MQTIKYHLMNSVSVLIFSFVLASTVTHLYRYSAEPSQGPSRSRTRTFAADKKMPAFDDYRGIITSGFFKIAQPESAVTVGTSAEGASAADLRLLGTISGPAPIARALIKKKTDPEAKIYKLRDNVFGFSLTQIMSSKVHLRLGKDVVILDLYAPENEGGIAPQSSSAPGSTEGKIQQTISRAFLQQKVLKKLDNALKGLQAGPYRVDGQIQGYRIMTIRPYNILYKLGARNGDIIKRVNGHPIDSTEKLYTLWGSIQGESRISVDLERNNKMMTYEFNISD
jgi:general secretion pathway protein C